MHVLESIITDFILNICINFSDHDICIDFSEHAWHNTKAEKLRDKNVFSHV